MYQKPESIVAFSISLGTTLLPLTTGPLLSDREQGAEIVFANSFIQKITLALPIS